MSTPHAGTFTAASGVHIHRGDALPAGHRGSVFIAESAQNLVQRQVLEPDGVTFRSRPARTGVEFLASRDSWFRPVFLANGPDGALYVVDMYRKDIDHPAYVPEPSRRLFDFTAGRNYGRIYRIAAADRPPAQATADPGDASAATLVAHLDHANAWRRETAQRRLIERDERAAGPRLRAMAGGASEAGRLHALWTMDALGVLEDADVARALQDPVAAVRENAVRIVERRGSSRLLEALRPLADDPDARVRLHVALALGAVNDGQRIPLLASIARRDGADRWIRAAVLSSVRDAAGAFFDAFAAAPPQSTGARAAVMQDLGRLFGATESAERCLSFVTAVADPGTEPSWQPAALSGLAAGLRSHQSGSETQSTLMALVSTGTAQARMARDRLATLMRRATGLAMLERAPAAQRLSAIELLANGDWTVSGATLLSLLQPQQPNDIQVAAVRALAAMRDPSAADRLVERSRWQAFTPRVRDAVLTALLSEDRLAPTLLDAVARRDVSASAVSPSRWQRLRNHRNPAIRQRAEALAVTGTGDAMRAYERTLREVTGLSGDPAHGAAVFTQFCSGCHTSGGRGGRVGPDLSGLRNQPVDALLLHIVVPDYEITPGFEAYTVETRDGRTIFGRLESDAPNSVTLRDASGQAHTIVRADVKSMTAGSASLMPAGLDQVMSAQALADLLAHLKQPQQP